MKYWEYSTEDLKKRKMYPLLSLQVFKSRKRIMTIYNSHRTETEKRQLITKEFQRLKKNVEQTITALRNLYDENEILSSDLERILTVLTNVTEYLYSKYGHFEKISEEVRRMITSLYNPIIEEEGIKKGLEKGMQEGMEKGIKKGKRESILVFLKENGLINENLKTKIEQEDDMDVLTKWLKLSAKVKSIDEFEARMYE